MELSKPSKISEIERDQIGRNLLRWLNTYPDIPPKIYDGLIQYEMLYPSQTCMTISTVQGTYISETDITGRREAEYQFKIIYRLPGVSLDDRVKADETLDNLAAWAAGQTPYIGENSTVIDIRQATLSSIADAYDDGFEDHQVFMAMKYQINA